jgi:hypothetical protein
MHRRTGGDLKSAEDIQSTDLARQIAELAFGLHVVFCSSLVGGLLLGVLFLLPLLLGGWGTGILLFLLGRGLVGWLRGEWGIELGDASSDPLAQWVHDCVARQQHRRRQRRLQRQLAEAEWRGVPDGALSRAQPTGPQQPTPASLSLAEPGTAQGQ